MQGQNQFDLLKTKRFLPLFVTQAVAAFNDNVYRYALAIMLLAKLGQEEGGLVNTLSAILFIIPFFLFSATGGQLADKFDKALVARRVKFVEIFIVGLQSYALFSDIIPLQQFCIFLAGLQAAFFGPVKYGILPQHLTKDELLGGNGMVEMATFIAVLAGTIFGALLINLESGKWIVSVVMISLAIFSWWTATKIPDAPATEPDLKINWNILGETWSAIKRSWVKPDVFQAILGVSWFWLLGVVFVTQIPLFTQSHLFGNETVSTLIFAMFSIAIAAGSVYCNRLLGGKITVKYVPIAAILMSVFMIDLFFAAGFAQDRIGAAIASGDVIATTSQGGDKTLGVMTIIKFYSTWRVFFDLAAVAFLSGLFVVPLFAVMQVRTPFYERARIIGSNNIINAAFMVSVSILSGILLAAGFTARVMFLLLGIANVFAAIYIIRLVPHDTLARVARFFFTLFFDVEVKGLENYKAAGRKALIIANHTSFLDGPLLSAFLPERAAFAVNTHIAKSWWMRPAFALADLCPIDPGNPLALRGLVKQLKQGKKVMIFPEGRITTTGNLMKIYEGPGAVAEMAGGRILPVRIDGAQYSKFSRLGGKYPLRWFPKITLSFLPPVEMDSPEHLKGAGLREHQAEKLYDVMSDMVFRTTDIDKTLWQSLLDARKVHGGKKDILEDTQRQPMSYNRLILGSFILGRKLAALTSNQRNVGVLLPTANATMVVVYGLHAFGRVPAMLNFSTGGINMQAACIAAEVRSIVTSRKFIELGEMQPMIDVLSKDCKIIYLEDVRASVGAIGKVRGLMNKMFAGLTLRQSGASRDPNSPAVILFTSGSEGLPKGVVLSHRNIVANLNQITTRVPFDPKDVFFTCLPLFHAFGFTATVLTLNNGIRAFLYPSPLHYKIVPEMVYDTQATVIIATDTFLTGYSRNAHPYDFQSLRFVVAGAERLKPETRQLWTDKFGLRIIEGYGATECAPCVSAQTPMHFKMGTVGRIFDGMQHRIEPVEGIAEGGRLWIKGPNVMTGYLRADNPGVIEAPLEGWYDTGDIVSVDHMKYVTILGRAKRFSKIAGEMISLGAIETKLSAAFPDAAHAVVAVPDRKKGEQLVLFTTLIKADRKTIADALKAAGVAELSIPKNIFTLETLPVLGSGKTDYVSLNKLGRDKVPE